MTIFGTRFALALGGLRLRFEFALEETPDDEFEPSHKASVPVAQRPTDRDRRIHQPRR